MTPKEEGTEMSIEEILSSIRKYVVEENIQANLPVTAPTKPTDSSKTKPIKIFDEDIIELTSPLEGSKHNDVSPSGAPKTSNPKAPANTTAAASHDKNIAVQSVPFLRQQLFPDSASATGKAIPEESTPQQNQDEGLVKLESITAAAHAFNKLLEVAKPVQEANAGLTIEQFVTRAVTPLIKQWLDENLTQIVENMIAKEIGRITKRAGENCNSPDR